jgi:CBS domain containing-hemolysin-like protein
MSAQPKSYKKLINVVFIIIFFIVLFLPIIPITYTEVKPEIITEKLDLYHRLYIRTKSLYLSISIYTSWTGC